MMRADSKREQLGRHNGANGIGFMMKLFQKVPAALKAVDHTSACAAIAGGKILLECGSELSNIVQQCGKVCGIFQPDRPQALRCPPRCAKQMCPNRLPNDLPARRLALVCIILHSNHLSSLL